MYYWPKPAWMACHSKAGIGGPEPDKGADDVVIHTHANIQNYVYSSTVYKNVILTTPPSRSIISAWAAFLSSHPMAV